VTSAPGRPSGSEGVDRPRDLTLRDATEADVPLVLHFVRALADYEELLHEVQATEGDFPACSSPNPAGPRR